jgi:hypothetical protein
MVYILEIKTTQTAAIKIVTDAVNSLITDANFEFRPYYIDDDENDEDNENTGNKTIGGVIMKEINKTGIILVYMRLDADKFDVYKYNYHKKKLTLGIDIDVLSGVTDGVACIN